jgi:hypothetical protein
MSSVTKVIMVALWESFFVSTVTIAPAATKFFFLQWGHGCLGRCGRRRHSSRRHCSRRHGLLTRPRGLWPSPRERGPTAPSQKAAITSREAANALINMARARPPTWTPIPPSRARAQYYPLPEMSLYNAISVGITGEVLGVDTVNLAFNGETVRRAATCF